MVGPVVGGGVFRGGPVVGGRAGFHSATIAPLSDGRLVRATLHVKNVKPSSQKPGSVDISYNVVTEVMAVPDVPIMDVHETVQ